MMRNLLKTLPVFAFLQVFAVTASATPPVAISECDQTVDARRAVLVADLACGPGQGGVTMARGGQLDLDGHSISVPPTHRAVACSGSCVVNGPGTIIGGNDAVSAKRRLRIVDVEVSGAQVDGIEANKIIVKKSVITGNGQNGADGHRNAKVIDSVISGNGKNGIFTGHERGRISVKSSDLTGNGVSATACGTPAQCADLSSSVEPRIAGNTQCGFWYNWMTDNYADLCEPD